MVAHPARAQADAVADGCRGIAALRVEGDTRSSHADRVVTETPIAMVYNGVAFAVMLATPTDLADFALGFALAEGIVARANEFELLDTLATARGVTLQAMIPHARFEALRARRRNLAGRSGCGLCGIESLEQAVRPSPRVASNLKLERAAVAEGMRALAAAQPLNRLTGGAHAAAFLASAAPPIVREDVGRHNALDKLVGALAARSHPGAGDGLLAITSRASWEIVHKAAHAGIAVIAAISAPTSLAIEAADAAGITLIAFARDDAMNVYTHPGRIR